MKYSFKLRVEKRRVRPDGTVALFYQVLINRKKTTVPLNLYWPLSHFDEQQGIKPRQRGDKLHEDYTRTIERKGNDINEVFIWARLANVELTIEIFLRELANQKSRYNFCAYWKRVMEERLAKGIITQSTRDSHNASLATLMEFKNEVMFNELNIRFLEDYRAWMFRQEGLVGNTIWKKLKEMRTYTNLAIQDGYHFDYPFKGFKMPAFTSRIDYLSEEEFLTLMKYYDSEELEDGHIITLRAFLFACYTGLRISDLMTVSWKEIRKDVMTFRPQKRPKDMADTVSIPLHPDARDMIPSQKGVLIPTVSEQSMNRTIKTIARKLELNPNITFHWARHTFATRFLRHGGRIEVLQQILGHKKIETTMIYVHVDESRKRDEICMLPRIKRKR